MKIWCESVLSRQVSGLIKEVNYRGKLSVPEKLALNDRWPFIGVASQNRFDCNLLVPYGTNRVNVHKYSKYTGCPTVMTINDL